MGISSKRSRTGGTERGIVLMRKNKSLRKRLSFMSWPRFWCVAATSRMLTRLSRTSPNRRKSLFLQNLENLGLNLQVHIADFVQEESSFMGNLKTVALVLTAPVKAPLSWPKSSCSSKIAGRPPQLGRPAVLWHGCYVRESSGRAHSSLYRFLRGSIPGFLRRQTRAATSANARMALLVPRNGLMPSRLHRAWLKACLRRFLWFSRLRSSITTSVGKSNGLVKSAPLPIPHRPAPLVRWRRGRS